MWRCGVSPKKHKQGENRKEPGKGAAPEGRRTRREIALIFSGEAATTLSLRSLIRDPRYLQRRSRRDITQELDIVTGTAQPAVANLPKVVYFLLGVASKLFKYTYTDPTGNTGNAYHLNLPSGAGTTVSWVILSTKNAATGTQKHSGSIFFAADTPFVDSNTSQRPVQAFSWSETEESSTLPSKASLVLDQDASGVYEYRIVVRDSVSGESNTEDPKIIVGGKSPLEVQLTDVNAKLDEADKAKTLEDTKKWVHSAQEELRKIIEELK
jgi:hypothetical protein